MALIKQQVMNVLLSIGVLNKALSCEWFESD